MAKIRFRRVYIQEFDGSVSLEHIALTDYKGAVISTLDDGIKMMKKMRVDRRGECSYWVTESLMFFDRVKDAKEVAEKWLNE